jgi:hypothetical protein
VPELPGLNDLVGLPIFRGHYADRILNGDSGTIRVNELHEELNTALLAAIRLLRFEMPGTANGQVRARGKCYDHIPSSRETSEITIHGPEGDTALHMICLGGIKNLQHVALDMPLRVAT